MALCGRQEVKTPRFQDLPADLGRFAQAMYHLLPYCAHVFYINGIQQPSAVEVYDQDSIPFSLRFHAGSTEDQDSNT